MKPTLHDYSNRYWGHDYLITKIIRDGAEIKTMGWGRDISVGDFILLQNGPKDTTRYKVLSIEYMTDPTDMWSATLAFAPRRKQTQKYPKSSCAPPDL